MTVLNRATASILNRIMKVVLIAVSSSVALLALCQTAEASKARLLALGQNVNGSQFILDNRDIFLDPATLNDLQSSANFEWGGSQGVQPRAEGGGIYRSDSLAYALQLGRLGDSTLAMVSSTTLGLLPGSLFLPQDSLDAIIGAGTGVLKWGAGLHYARSVSNVGATANYPDSNARDLQIDGGVELARFAAYLKLDLISASNTDLSGGGQVSYTGQTGGELGGKFNFDDRDSITLVYTRRLFGFNNGSGTIGNFTEQKIRSDYFRKIYADDKTFVFITAGLSYDEGDVTYQSIGTQALKVTTFTSPLVLGLEYKALSWLTLRTSAAQNVLIDQSKLSNGLNDYDRANLESTTVAAGLSVYVGNLQLDATFTGSDSAYTPSGGTAGSANGRLDGTNLAENTSITYTF